MIHLVSSSILESNKSKIFRFKNPNISKNFTCSIEIEMETRDTKGNDEDYDENEIENIISIIRNSTIKELYRVDGFEINDELESFIEDILYEIENDYDDYEYIVDKVLKESLYKNDKIKKKIIGIVRPMVLNYFFSDNLSYLSSKLKKNLPNFWKKWGSKLKIEMDNTLKRGIEISNSSYLNDINDLISLINDFYHDFNNQKYWIFNSRTGIHLNIGPSNTKGKFNPIKGLLFLNDQGKSPFVFTNMEWRKKSKFCGSLISEISSDRKKIKKCSNLLSSGKISECEKILNDSLIKSLREKGYKNYGVNLLPIETNNYVEFRYPGGKIDSEILIEKLLYFTYILHLMTNEEYDRKDYLKKLFKILN